MTDPKLPSAADIISRLEQIVQYTYPDWQVSGIEAIGTGLESLVCRGRSPALGPLAIRVPWARWSSNDNDAMVDARLLLEQEAALAAYMGRHGVATPRIFALHRGDDDFDFLVSEFIENDSSPPDEHSFGAVLRKIHAARLPDFPLAMQKTTPLERTLAERISQRAAVVEQLTGLRFDLPAQDEIQTMLTWPGRQQVVLHMDARPANLLTWRGAIAAIVDWSNALVGDPALELARIAEYGYLSQSFLNGYGVEEPFAELPRQAELLYRLDTAIMLAVVFLSEAPAPELAEPQVQRVQELRARL